MYDANPEIQAQFPQGILQFAQVVVGMGEDGFDMLMPHLFAQNEGQPANRMPGQLDEVEDLDDDVANDNDEHGSDDLENAGHTDDRDDSDPSGSEDGNNDDESATDDDDEPPQVSLSTICWAYANERSCLLADCKTLPARVWQNLINRFWGGGAPAG